VDEAERVGLPVDGASAVTQHRRAPRLLTLQSPPLWAPAEPAQPRAPSRSSRLNRLNGLNRLNRLRRHR